MAINNLIPDGVTGLGNTRYNDVDFIVNVEEIQTPSKSESQSDSLEASNPEPNKRSKSGSCSIKKMGPSDFGCVVALNLGTEDEHHPTCIVETCHPNKRKSTSTF